jgi:hypothetical protein
LRSSLQKSAKVKAVNIDNCIREASHINESINLFFCLECTLHEAREVFMGFLILNIRGFIKLHAVNIPVNNCLTAKINFVKTLAVINAPCIVYSTKSVNKYIYLALTVKCRYFYTEAFLCKSSAFKLCAVVNMT